MNYNRILSGTCLGRLQRDSLNFLHKEKVCGTTSSFKKVLAFIEIDFANGMFCCIYTQVLVKKVKYREKEEIEAFNESLVTDTRYFFSKYLSAGKDAMIMRLLIWFYIVFNKIQ